MLMDDSHTRVYRRPEAMVAALERRGLRTESVEHRPYHFGIGPEQAALIRQKNAEEKLGRHRRDDGRWAIKLQITCLIATETTNGRKGNEERS